MRLSWLTTALSVLAIACGDDSPAAGGGSGAGGSAAGGGGAGGADAYDWGLPPGYPVPKVPADNPMSEAKVELGRRLFFDTRLSGNETFSCGTCHQQALAFTDGLATAVGSTGQTHPRGSMSTVNVGYLNAFTWANPVLEDLEAQALVPMFGESPVELGLAGMDEEVIARLSADADYPMLFAEAFPEESDPIQIATITYAIAAFQRSIISYRSAWDRYNYDGQASALSEAASCSLVSGWSASTATEASTFRTRCPTREPPSKR